eukprot:m.60134 g.60134  ORF g.60134 m.60134 type:complete len:635 (-) comp49319_c0_seq3:2092-3996(-)
MQRDFKLAATLLVLAVAHAATALSITLRVSPTGSDAPSCLIPSGSTCATIRYAVTNAVLDELDALTVQVAAGRYSNECSATGISPTPLTSLEITGPTPPSMATIDCQGAGRFIEAVNVNLTLINLNISNGFSQSDGGLVLHGINVSAIPTPSSSYPMLLTIQACSFSSSTSIGNGGCVSFVASDLLDGSGAPSSPLSPSLTIQITQSSFFNCSAEQSSEYNGNGGGLSVVEAQSYPVSSNRIIQSNSFESCHAAAFGGAIFIKGDHLGTPPANDLLMVSDCLFQSCSALWGGGVELLENSSSIGANYTFAGSIFLNCKANWGAGIDLTFQGGVSSGTALAILANNFNGGSFYNASASDASWGGGVSLFAASLDNCKITVADNDFQNCIALKSGGGVYLFGDAFINVDLTISNTTFKGNGAVLFGGGISITSARWVNSSALVEDSNFSKNFAFQDWILGESGLPGGTGGAVSFCASDMSTSSLTIQTSIFDNNTASSGGAIYVAPPSAPNNLEDAFWSASSFSLSSSTFLDNQADIGGALSWDFHKYSIPTSGAPSNFIIHNITSTQNFASSVGGALSASSRKRVPTWIHRAQPYSSLLRTPRLRITLRFDREVPCTYKDAPLQTLAARTLTRSP